MNGLYINGTNINSKHCVDETTLLANNNEDLQKIFVVVKRTSEHTGLDMNVKKMKTIVINKNEDMQAKIKVDGSTI